MTAGERFPHFSLMDYHVSDHAYARVHKYMLWQCGRGEQEARTLLAPRKQRRLLPRQLRARGVPAVLPGLVSPMQSVKASTSSLRGGGRSSLLELVILCTNIFGPPNAKRQRKLNDLRTEIRHTGRNLLAEPLSMCWRLPSDEAITLQSPGSCILIIFDYRRQSRSVCRNP